MEHRIIVVGIGPGHADYLLPMARQVIAAARVLVGGKRALAAFSHAGQETMPVMGDIQRVMGYIHSKLEQQDIVVMVSGDPGYYSLLDALRQEFPLRQLQVIPGISSMQFAFARLALPWHEARLLSMHGRMPKQEELAYRPGALLGILTDKVHNSQSISTLLLQCGWPEQTEIYICTRLSYENEKIVHTNLEKAQTADLFTHCIMVVRA